ncbi:MAG: DUF58 domain-containing protein [Lachnospiraceae bacterium]|nr:DUF58 domain-containing protein [Lachnospiraceae bacterium]MBQ7832664.1 DUF58 domain-containing protein [Lachnospiraceae bacterium]
MMNHIIKIQAKVSVYAKKKTSNIFDGSYKSIYTGNGLDFENLREYIPGDNIRDIDWKASARNKNLLIKQYIAEKKHNVLLVMDSGRGFLADTPAEETKKDVALTTAGTLAYLATQNGDNVGAVYNRGGMIQYYPLRRGLNHLEQILTAYDKEDFAAYDSDLNKCLEYIIKNIPKRMIIFVITDAAGIHKVDERTIKMLCAQHDLLFVSIGDTTMTGKKSYDVKRSVYVADYIAGNKKLMKTETLVRKKIAEENDRKLIRNRIVNIQIDSEADIVDKSMELLERHKTCK